MSVNTHQEGHYFGFVLVGHSAYYFWSGQASAESVHFGPRYPQQHHQQVPNTDICLVLQTLAESVQSNGARMDAVETPCGTPGRVQAPNPLSSVATAPFYFQQPSGSASTAFKGYAPGTCPATMATAVPALAPAAYSLSQLYQSIFRFRVAF
ncbi:unnamed protein product [Boreogadus saida]